MQTIVAALLEAQPSRRVLVLDVTEIRGYKLLTEANNAEVVYRVRIHASCSFSIRGRRGLFRLLFLALHALSSLFPPFFSFLFLF
jgi:hypothetical protein